MQLHLLKSKIHRARVTDANLDYEGSLSISTDLMAKCGIRKYERVLCTNAANGARFETYAIPGKPGEGEIVLNGAAAHLGKVGDRLTIMSYAIVDESEAENWKPTIIVLGENNTIASQRGL